MPRFEHIGKAKNKAVDCTICDLSPPKLSKFSQRGRGTTPPQDGDHKRPRTENRPVRNPGHPYGRKDDISPSFEVYQEGWWTGKIRFRKIFVVIERRNNKMFGK
ncbi:hypothetical protein HOLleu_38138 [Holothuria leucospilota]|uniref:Uncharacterized protein n=1 Tax=Holothuria leucospilota TaxID=206669 RepID=A0A9Q0YIB9_HOLLE|nr:hypothetical protein HOLleu_38138 [Holothuria leucospilota]